MIYNNYYKLFNYILSFLNILLYCYIIGFYSFVIRVRLIISRWPSYENPDPKLLNLTTHIKIIDFFFTISVISIFLISILIFLSKIIRIKITYMNIYIYISGIIIILYNLLFDPFYTWYVD